MVAVVSARTLARVSMVAAALLTAWPGVAQARKVRHDAAPVSATPVSTAALRAIALSQLPGQPLRFFTIAERLAALRARGVLPAEVAPVPMLIEAVLPGESPPAPAELGLRLSAPATTPETLLGTVVFPAPGGDLAEKWRGALVRWDGDETRIASCEKTGCTERGMRKWLDIRNGAMKRSGLERLAYIHQALNLSIAYGTDFQIFGVADYWASPLEVVERAGDCEDYAIAKYLMLQSTGFDPAEMKLVALHETFSGQYHAILAIKFEGAWVFMDNKRGSLTHEGDYTDTRPVATVDAGGQSMLIKLEKNPFTLRMSSL